MKIKTSELTGPALDWAVAKVDGYDKGWLERQLNNPNPSTRGIPHYSTDWSDGGPIIEREKMGVEFCEEWHAMRPGEPRFTSGFGPTPLIAAMRCFVASKLGDKVDVPEELA